MSFPSCGWAVRVIYELGAVTLRLFLTPWKETELYGVWESGLMEPDAPVFPILSALRMATMQALGAHSGELSFLVLEIMITKTQSQFTKTFVLF